MADYTRGEVVIVELRDPEGGHEKAGTRPCIIVQNDVQNIYRPLTIIVTVTDRQNIKKMYPVFVEIKAPEGGLTIDSVAECVHLYTIDKRRILSSRGKVSSNTMTKIDEAIKVALSLF